MAYLSRGFGAVDPNAGTYADPNCPLYCWMAGNIVDQEIFGNRCWPCHNVCPPNTGWDPNTLGCDTAGAGAPEAIPTTSGDSPNPCPDGQVWNTSDGQCENAILSSLAGYMPWILGGSALLAVLVLVPRGKRGGFL
jgi:hypothetical protein